MRETEMVKERGGEGGGCRGVRNGKKIEKDTHGKRRGKNDKKRYEGGERKEEGEK